MIKKISNFFSNFNTGVSILVISLLFSVTARVFALPYVPSDNITDPSCSFGDADCYVNPLAIGESVASSTANAVLFVDENNLLAEDGSDFLYDPYSGYLYSDNFSLANNMEIITTTDSSTGVITKAGVRFLHTYKPAGTNDNLFFGKGSGNFSLSATSNFNANTGIGENTLATLTSGYFNTAVGASSLRFTTTGNSNTAFGLQAGNRITTGTYNTAIGRDALYGASSPSSASGSYNVAVGNATLYSLSSGSNNIGIGNEAGLNLSSGGNNVLLGFEAGHDLTTESGNIFIGYQSGTDTTGSNQLYIENSSSTSPLIYGDFANDYVNINGRFGIGTATPDFEQEIVSESQNVEVVSSAYNGRKPVFAGRVANGTEASPTAAVAGDILAEFAGQGYGATAFASSTTASMRVVAEETFDDSGYGTQLLFRTTPNNSTTLTSRMVIMADGNVGIGDTSPASLFTVGSGDLFQVNSSGAIAAATGITSSGTITFSGLSSGVVINSSGVLSSTAQLAASRGGTAINTASSTGIPVITSGTWSVPTTFVYDTSGNMLGIGDATPDFKLDVETDAASSAAASFFNDGNSTNRAGVIISAGVDDHTAASTSTLLSLRDGDGTTVGSITFGSSVTAFNTTSDERLKENITDTEIGINDLMNIKVRDFTWKADKDSKVTHGFIAQELFEVYPGAVTLPAEENGYWMVDYSKLTPLVVRAIQELKIEVDLLSSLNTEEDSSLASLIKTFLADAENTIDIIFAKIINTEKVQTNELCVGSVCITEEEFIQVFGNNQSDNNQGDDENTEDAPLPDESGEENSAPEEISGEGDSPVEENTENSDSQTEEEGNGDGEVPPEETPEPQI